MHVARQDMGEKHLARSIHAAPAHVSCVAGAIDAREAIAVRQPWQGAHVRQGILDMSRVWQLTFLLSVRRRV